MRGSRELLGQLANRPVGRDVDVGLDADAERLELGRRLPARGDYGVAAIAQVPRELEPDAAIGPRDERGPHDWTHA